LLPDGSELKLSPGPHNLIQKSVIEEFLPRFAPRSEVLYIGDTEKKILILKEHTLFNIGVPRPSREMLPDVLAYDAERNWLLVIEAVHSANPIGQIRHKKLKELTRNCTAGCVFVSAFENKRSFRKFSNDISWQTEVWIADDPDHLIHFDGERFLGPYDWPAIPNQK
jgi:type II restriction enzyme